MHDDMPNPSERPARDELPPRLRAAIEQVHAQPLPFGSISDALDRAKRLEGTPMNQARKYGWRQMAMAAAVLLTVLLGPMLAAFTWKQPVVGDDEAQYADADWEYRIYNVGPIPGGRTELRKKYPGRGRELVQIGEEGQTKAFFLDDSDSDTPMLADLPQPRDEASLEELRRLVETSRTGSLVPGLRTQMTPAEQRTHPVADLLIRAPDGVNIRSSTSDAAKSMTEAEKLIRDQTVTRGWTELLRDGNKRLDDKGLFITGEFVTSPKEGKDGRASGSPKSATRRRTDDPNVISERKGTTPGSVRVLGSAVLSKIPMPEPQSFGPATENEMKKLRERQAAWFEEQKKVVTSLRGEAKEKKLHELEEQINEERRLLVHGRGVEDIEGLRLLTRLRDELKKSIAKPPQVWKQHRGRPTFARVYIGDGNALELVSLHVTTTIDGPRARTVVDHVFRNPHERQLEGTFEYPLPTGASPSYYAMFPGKTGTQAPPLFARRGQAPPLAGELLASLKPNEMARAISSDDWGNLMESRVVNKQKALETYEEVTRQRVDPALLEYSGGNTFSGRVFPIPPKGFTRVLLAYEELLPVVGDDTVYRFALPDCKLQDVQFTFQADASLVGRISNPSEKAADWKSVPRENRGKRIYEKHWTTEGPGGEVRFTFTPPEPRIHVTSGRQNDGGPLYVYARVRPELKAERNAAAAPPPRSQTGVWERGGGAERGGKAENAVFLLDTSLSEHPDRFAVNMLLMRRILESDPDIAHFNILAFNVGAAWVSPKGWIRNTKAGRERAFNALDGIVLEGATDFSSALDKLSATPFIVSRQPLNVFVLSDGQITWGESDVNTLVSRFEQRCPATTRFHCYRTGLGADNLELFSALTRRGGGVFNCYSAADLPAVAVAHRNQCFTVDSVHFVGGPAVSDVLIAGRRAAVYPGGELIVAGRAAETGKTTLVVEGTYLGKKLVREYPVEITGNGELAARGWGEVAVASLLSLNDPKNEALVTAYCQQFGIGSRVASFLILENQNEYKRFNLDEERGKLLADDLGKWLDEAWKGLGKPLSAKEAFTRFLERIEPRVKLMSGAQGEHVRKLLELMTDADCELPAVKTSGPIVRKNDVAAVYLAARDSDPRNVNTYLTEARRRAAKQDVDGAVRALSSIIEEYPGRGDALRLVGYRLLDMRQPAHAAGLFDRVERSRPFEPHSYRDLARALEAAGKYGLAAIHYEIILAGTWHARFHASLKQVALEEYAAMMRDALRRKAVTGKLADQFGERLEKMDPSKAQADLRVTISWNTDATDVDLWVIEPDGEKCFYSHNKTKSGGELSQDMTQGYGPERYQAKQAQKGTYRVIVNYFRMNPNLLAGETHVNVTVTRFAGTPQETTERHTVILRRDKEEVEVCRVEY